MTRPKLKICGITSTSQAVEIASMEVNALGFILYPKSPRYITPAKVKEILQNLPPYTKTVGVFVDESHEKISDIYRMTGLDLVQLSGDESPEYCRRVGEMGISWVKSFRIKDTMDEDELVRYASDCVQLDAWSADEYGGTGKSFDWDLIQNLKKQYKIILAGGINPDNVQNAIQTLQPYAIDVSSGVEYAPGNKSLDKIELLITRMLEL